VKWPAEERDIKDESCRTRGKEQDTAANPDQPAAVPLAVQRRESEDDQGKKNAELVKAGNGQAGEDGEVTDLLLTMEKEYKREAQQKKIQEGGRKACCASHKRRSEDQNEREDERMCGREVQFSKDSPDVEQSKNGKDQRQKDQRKHSSLFFQKSQWSIMEVSYRERFRFREMVIALRISEEWFSVLGVVKKDKTTEQEKEEEKIYFLIAQAVLEEY